ncbi:hypothetical protein [Corynebacterium sp. HMSC28B08]|nr:hypothetical protein [Corynebacterium sp. HMSC28B08]
MDAHRGEAPATAVAEGADDSADRGRECAESSEPVKLRMTPVMG